MKYELTATRLREAMREKGLKASQLCQLSGVKRASVSHYMNGNNVPNNIQAYKMAKVLDVKPEWLMGLDEMQNYIVVENTQLQQEIAGMTTSQLNRLLAYAQKIRKEEKDEGEV